MTDLADVTSHRIEGFTNHGGGLVLNMPLFSQINPTLWMGGCPRGRAPDTVNAIVSLYPGEPYETHVGQHIAHFWMNDGDEVPAALFHAAADLVNALRDDGTVLVHCQAGLNRSGTVAALALMKRGMTPDEAIALLREKRDPAVLCNPTFKRWLLDGAPR